MKLLISFQLLLFVCLVEELCARQETLAHHEPVSPIGESAIDEKLDKILASLDIVSSKQEQLEQLLELQQKQQCQCTSAALPATAVSNLNLPQDQVSRRSIVSQKLESASDVRDLFHFNKLSANSIPSSSSPWSQVDESSLASWLSNDSGRDSDASTIQLSNEQLSSLGDQLGSVFGENFANLTLLVRDQMGAFRTTLTKLMNRQIDHSYQYNAIANQLSMLKEECSLASSQLQSDSSMCKSSKTDGTTSEQQTGPLGASTMRSSDVAMIVRLLSQELNQLASQRSSRQVNGDEELENQSKQVKELEQRIESLNKSMGRKLEEIDSVVKQSVLLLIKLNTQPRQATTFEQHQEPLVLTYTNSNSTSNTTTGELPVQTQTDTRTTSRWFSGSKVPGKQRDELAAAQQTQKISVRRCQSKTSLVRPTSCQQLRLAGANCTGQYYVFVRGSIRHVYCDMNMDSDDNGGGWTVILRRIDKSRGLPATELSSQVQGRRSNHLLEAFRASQVNFELDWANYKSGFGQLDDWGEFFIGLEPLNDLTSEWIAAGSNGSQQVEMQIDVSASNGSEYHLRFDRFQVGDEDSQYKLELGACNSTHRLCQPLVASNGSEFYTIDKPLRSAGNQSCRTAESGPKVGWWWPGDCQRELFALTAPLGRQANGSLATINWPLVAHEAGEAQAEDIQVKRVVMKIRFKRAKPLQAKTM